MDLEPLDVLVTVNDRQDLYSKIKRWAVGRYDHVGVYLGLFGSREYPFGFPAVFESVDRGVLIRSMHTWETRRVVVMRINIGDLVTHEAAIFATAVKMAADPKAFYDYPAILRWAIPRIILQKLHLPIPQTWRRDARHICSEAVCSLLEDNGVDALPDTQLPLPGDFVNSGALVWIEEGRIYHYSRPNVETTIVPLRDDEAVQK